MPEFIADTTGTVHGLEWDQLAAFTQGYVEALLFTETIDSVSMVEWTDPENQDDIQEGRVSGTIPGDSGWGDIHPDTFDQIQRDCMEFERQAFDLLIEAHKLGYDRELAGRDFWFTRNGHGVGFWDRKVLEDRTAWAANGSPLVGEPGWDQYMIDRENSLGRRLTAIAKGFGETWAGFEPDPESPTGYGFVHLS